MSQNDVRHASHPKRRLLLLDRRFQVGLASKTVLLMVSFGMAYSLGVMLLGSATFAKFVGEQTVGPVTVAAEVLFFAAATLITHIAVVRVSHAIAGPALVLTRGLSKLSERELDNVRFTLREGDYLGEVAEAAEATRRRMIRDRAVIHAIADRLRNAGESKVALDAADQLFDLFRLEGEEAESSGSDETGAKRAA